MSAPQKMTFFLRLSVRCQKSNFQLVVSSSVCNVFLTILKLLTARQRVGNNCDSQRARVSHSALHFQFWALRMMNYGIILGSFRFSPHTNFWLIGWARSSCWRKSDTCRHPAVKIVEFPSAVQVGPECARLQIFAISNASDHRRSFCFSSNSL